LKRLAPVLVLLGAAIFAAPVSATVQRTVLAEEFGWAH
jgi:hypothetical protein